MSTQLDSSLVAAQLAFFGNLRKNWGWLLAFGILAILLGILGLGMTFGLTLASIELFGILLIVGGAFQLFNAFKCKGWKSTVWHLLIALLYIAAGVIMVIDPVLASVTLTLVIAWILIAVGIMRSIMAFQMRKASGWYWPLISGVVSIALGVMIIVQWPISGLWVIGLFVAIELILHGWSYVFVALAARKAGTDEAAAA
jgi:uncharacterized membrane protein HdeD (DUF308 family)